MKYIYNPSLGIGLPVKEDPSKEILNSVKTSLPIEVYDKTRRPRENIIIGTINNTNHLIVRINTQWRDCGIITNMPIIMKHINGPLVNFHLVWTRGKKLMDIVEK